MVDNKGDDPKASETKPGAVRPPVLDLKARPTGADSTRTDTPGPAAGNPGKPGAAAGGTTPKPADASRPTDAAKPADKTKPAEAPRPSTMAATPTGFGFGAALVGGLLGLGAAYGLAYAGLWPAPPAAPIVPDQRLASFSKAIPELETVTQTTQAELSTLNQRVTTLEKAPAAAASADTGAADLTALDDRLAALSDRVDGLAASPAAAADASAVETLRADLAALGSRIDELGARIGTAESSLSALDSTVSQNAATLASQPSDIGAVLQLPLILSGFETAFATGRPYETELAALRAADPKVDIPTGIANQAPKGLTRPDVIAQRFDAVLPAILAGRPSDPDAQWQKGALDWFAGAIALRPTGEVAGDSPEAITSRLIGAVERRDFATAQSLLASLPQPMQAAAADVPAMIAEQAEAEKFLQQLRDTALSGEVTQ